VTGALEQHLLNFQVEVRTALSDVALHVKRLQMDTQSLYKTLASVSDLGAPTVRRYSSGNLHCRAQAVSGVQSVTVPADSSTEVHTKLDDLSSLVKSSHEASRKITAQAVHSIQNLLLNIEKTTTQDMADLKHELREIKTGIAAKTPMASASTRSDNEQEASELDLQDDPRKTIAAFFQQGDDRGPSGSLERAGLVPDLERPDTRWFCVFRPTSSEAISKMVFSQGSGKGLNVKGKSAKTGALSGFVPFLQISDNIQRQQLLTPPPDSHFQLFYTKADSRKLAKEEMEKILQEMIKTSNDAQVHMEEMQAGIYNPTAEEEQEVYQKILMYMKNPSIEELTEYEPVVYGLDVPERLFREVYVNRKDLTASDGWHTGRKSVPAFSNMNIQTTRKSMLDYRESNGTTSRVVLYQVDKIDPLNPHALVMAYAESDGVKPVVSDFDAFLVGSKGMRFEPLTGNQADLICWSLDQTQEILSRPSTHPWSARWIHTLKTEADKGFHPEIPELGFGDPTTYKLFEDLVAATSTSGAVRHGAECFNFYFPQELDPEYLVIWEGFGAKKPWAYLSEPDLRSWLIERVYEGFCFPLNPVWPVRDTGWYEVLQSLRNSSSAAQALAAWYPQEAGILEKIDAIHEKHPSGFTMADLSSRRPSNGGLDVMQHSEIKTTSVCIAASGLSACEAADFGLHQVQCHLVLKRAKRKLKAFLLLNSLNQRLGK